MEPYWFAVASWVFESYTDVQTVADTRLLGDDAPSKWQGWWRSTHNLQSNKLGVPFEAVTICLAGPNYSTRYDSLRRITSRRRICGGYTQVVEVRDEKHGSFEDEWYIEKTECKAQTPDEYVEDGKRGAKSWVCELVVWWLNWKQVDGSRWPVVY